MIYFLVPILILFGIRTTLIERVIPETDVISSHLSFYLYGYEILIFVSLIVFLMLNRVSKKKQLLFLVSIPILLALVFFSKNEWITFLHVFRVINLAGFALILHSMRLEKIKQIYFQKGLILASLLMLIIASLQFMVQGSLGLIWFHEAVIDLELVGVAKFQFQNLVFVRPYGVLPHPNILGWLGVSIFAYTYMSREGQNMKMLFFFSQTPYLLFDHMHVTYSVVGYALVMLWGFSKSELLEKNDFENQVLVFVSTGLVLLSFSRLAWGIYLVLLVVNIIQNRKLFHVEQLSFTRTILAICVVPIFFFGMAWRFFQLFSETSLGLRQIYLIRSWEIISQNFFHGVGFGNYIIGLQDVSELVLIWQYEPVHNAFLLVFSEVGLLGSIIVFIWYKVYVKAFK